MHTHTHTHLFQIRFITFYFKQSLKTYLHTDKIFKSIYEYIMSNLHRFFPIYVSEELPRKKEKKRKKVFFFFNEFIKTNVSMYTYL